MDKNIALLIANLAVWPVIAATALTMILYACLRLAYRYCFQKSKRHYMMQLKDYGQVNRDHDRRLQNDYNDVEDKLTGDKMDQRASDTNSLDITVAGIEQLRVTSYSSEDESLTDDVMTVDQQTETDFENTLHVTELETTTEPMYSKPNSTAHGRDGDGPDARKDRSLRPIRTPRLKSSSSIEQQTRERTNASTEAIRAQMADGFENRDKDNIFPSTLTTRTKTLPPSVSNALKDTKLSPGPPLLPSTLPNWTRRGRKPPINALQKEKAGSEDLHGDTGEELTDKSSNIKRNPTPPKTAPLMPLVKCPLERECQTISVRKNFMSRRPTSPPPSVPDRAGKNIFETTECSLSGAEGGGAISREEPTNTYDEICDEELHDADINHYDAIEDHLYDCIDDMPRSRRSGHRPNLARQRDVFRTEGTDDKDFVNPFYARRLERSCNRKMKRQEVNSYASLLGEDKADPGNQLSLSEPKTAIPDQRMNPRVHIGPQFDAMGFKAEPLRNSLDSGYLTAIETHPYKVHLSGYRREISKEGSTETVQLGNEPASVKHDGIPQNDPSTYYMNECMDVDKASATPPLAANEKEIKEDGHYEDLSSNPFVSRTKSLKPSVPPKPKHDERYS